MRKGFFIPLRFKILVSLLLGIAIVVGVITFTMANLFHKDKTAYINLLHFLFPYEFPYSHISISLRFVSAKVENRN